MWRAILLLHSILFFLDGSMLWYRCFFSQVFFVQGVLSKGSTKQYSSVGAFVRWFYSIYRHSTLCKRGLDAPLDQFAKKIRYQLFSTALCAFKCFLTLQCIVYTCFTFPHSAKEVQMLYSANLQTVSNLNAGTLPAKKKT